MHNGYCTFPIGSSYTWVNISKTGSQIFTCGPRIRPNLGIWLGDFEGGGKKCLTPSIYPLGGHGTPKFFSLGSTESLLYCQISRPCDKNWGLGRRGKFLIFLNSNLQHEVWQQACTRANYCFYFILQWTKFAKKNSRTGFWISSPFWRYGLPNFTNFFGKFLPKIHVEVTLAIFGQFPWPNRTSWVNSFYSTLQRNSSRKNLKSAFWISSHVLEIWPPKLYHFFGKCLPKIHVGLVWGI